MGVEFRRRGGDECMIVLEQIKLPIGHTKEELDALVYKKLGAKKEESIEYQVLKRSIDARKKPDIFFVYKIKIISDLRLKKYDKRHVCIVEDRPDYSFPEKMSGYIGKEKRPVIVGFGPAGMFASFLLARAGFCPIVLERGKDADKRQKDVLRFWETGELNEESNVSFGEGGAGTFSDGKLNTGIGSAQGRSEEVLKILVEHGAPESILIDNKPHLGTDLLCEIVKSMRKEVIRLGGKVLFESRFKSLIIKGGEITGCVYEDLNTGKEIDIETENICLCTGHSARDTFYDLFNNGVKMVQKDFAVGIRVIHPQKVIDDYVYGISDPGEMARKGIPAGDYKLTGKACDGRGVYSFCMCPGGFVVDSSSESGGVVVNGMSYSGRDAGFANSAIVTTVSGRDFGTGLFDGLEFQRKMERMAFRAGNGLLPVQYYGDFSENKRSSGLGDISDRVRGRTVGADLNEILPPYISGAIKDVMPEFGRRIRGFDADDAICLGVETRTSSPVRILRGKELMSEIPGLFPCGEGAGYAGGITSAAVDGIRVAEAVAKRIVNRI